MSTPNPISLGIVGLGSFGSSFVDLFAAHPLVHRIALCDREPDRVAAMAKRAVVQTKLRAADCYTSFDAICASDLDALAIITQPWLHAPQAVQAMTAGKHVYSAVPVVSLPDGDTILAWCNRLVETVQQSGQHYMLGETTCYRAQTMYCRRQAAAGAFGNFVYAEGEYLHDVDLPSSNLREVRRRRLASSAGQEWAQAMGGHDISGGPMHYPTHSTSGPIFVMNAHALKVSAIGFLPPQPDPYFGDEYSNETALFTMSNGATMRICEFRQVGHTGEEIFRLFGTDGSFRENSWIDKTTQTLLTTAEMREPLPANVEAAFRNISQSSDFYGGHGGSHAYLVHEFVDAIAHDRAPTIDIYQAVRYMAAGVMAHKSALRDGEWLAVPDWGSGR
ncbi:MAG: Gfo/Idh/MocA family oxidoreductase [Caldilineaceae bacterium]